MAISGLSRLKTQLKSIDKKIEQIVMVTITQYANKILDEAVSKVSTNLVNVRASYSLVIDNANRRVNIETNNEMIAYLEFGTGNPQTVRGGMSAKEYLATQPKEVKDAAIQFFVTGEGTIPAQPHLFPTWFKYRDEIIPEIDKRVQSLFDRL